MIQNVNYSMALHTSCYSQFDFSTATSCTAFKAYSASSMAKYRFLYTLWVHVEQVKHRLLFLLFNTSAAKLESKRSRPALGTRIVQLFLFVLLKSFMEQWKWKCSHYPLAQMLMGNVLLSKTFSELHRKTNFAAFYLNSRRSWGHKN